jgi:hypothetical protein
VVGVVVGVGLVAGVGDVVACVRVAVGLGDADLVRIGRTLLNVDAGVLA